MLTINNASKVQAWTSEEAMVQGGLDWDIIQGSVQSTLPNGDILQLPQYKSIVRADNNVVLSVMSNRYTPLQNKEKFKWADDLVAQGGAVFEQVGYFGQGEVNWLLAKLPNGLDYGNSKDVLDKYLMFADSYNGQLAFVTKFTTIRVVCQNTFDAALKQTAGVGKHRVKHTPNVLTRINDVRQSLGLVDAYYTMLGESLKKMADKPVNSDEAYAFFQQVLGIGEKTSTRTANIHSKMVDMFQGDAVGAELAGQTAWGAMNVLTEYADHHAGFKGDESNRVKSSWFGANRAMKQRGFDILTDLVDADYALVPAKMKVGKSELVMSV